MTTHTQTTQPIPVLATEPIEAVIFRLREGGYVVTVTGTGVTAMRGGNTTLKSADAQPLLLQLMRRQAEAIAAAEPPLAEPQFAEVLLKRLTEIGGGWQLVTTRRGPAVPVWRNEADFAAFTDVVRGLMAISPRVIVVPEWTDPLTLVAALKDGVVRPAQEQHGTQE